MRWGTLTNLAIILFVSGILLFLVFRASLERVGVDARIFYSNLIIDRIAQDLKTASSQDHFWREVRKACRKHPGLRLVIYDKSREALGGCGERLVRNARVASPAKRSIEVLPGPGFGLFSPGRVLVDIKGGFPPPAHIARFILRLPPVVFNDSIRFFTIYLGLTQISLFLLGYLLFHRMIIGPVRETARLAAKTAGLTNDSGISSHSIKGTDIQTISLSLMAMIKRIQRDKEDMARLLEQLKETNQELAAAQEGLVRSEKLASAGRLAAGVAHEVGNPLQIAMGYVELLRDETDPEQRSEILERAEAELTRIDAILQRLLDFAKPVSENIMETDLNALVRECGQLIEGRKGFRRIKVRLDLDESIPRVRTEPEKIRQILVNLIFNAVDAIGDNPGLILLSTNAFDQRVEIGVQDSGTGVAPELKSRIYDPFFTTKPPGHGTGLGLAVCLGLAESIDGTLEIDSDGANGTAAILSLPLKN